jgi:hypothetical protein
MLALSSNHSLYLINDVNLLIQRNLFKPNTNKMESCIVSVRNLNLFIKNTNVGPKVVGVRQVSIYYAKIV